MKKHQAKSIPSFRDYAIAEIRSWAAGSTIELEDEALLEYVAQEMMSLIREKENLVSMIKGIAVNAMKSIEEYEVKK
jgi:hypothetical protein